MRRRFAASQDLYPSLPRTKEYTACLLAAGCCCINVVFEFLSTFCGIVEFNTSLKLKWLHLSSISRNSMSVSIKLFSQQDYLSCLIFDNNINSAT